MGKKRIISGKGSGVDAELKTRALSRLPKKKISSGRICIESTYNNTLITLTDKKGDVLTWSSAGSVGFKGTKKGTPFAASKVAELIIDKAKLVGIKDLDVEAKGVGPGRESALRTFVASGLEINSLKDRTPVPHNGPKPPKTRRV